MDEGSARGKDERRPVLRPLGKGRFAGEQSWRSSSGHAVGVALEGLGGLRLTFALLARSADKRVEHLLSQALTELDPHIQVGAVETMLARHDRAGLSEAVAETHLLSSHAVNFLVEHVETFLPLLRELVAAPQVQTRANVVDLVCRVNKVKLAYLLVRALDDSEERIVENALTGLEKLTRRYHQQVEAARAGRLELTREELESRKFALIDPLLAKLSPNRARSRVAATSPSSSEDVGRGPFRTGVGSPEVLRRLLELSMGLDSRTDDLLYRILINPHDPRSRVVAALLELSSSPQTVSFIVGMLHSRSKRPRALTILERRGEADFVRSLLAIDRLFTEPTLREALSGLRRIPWLESYAPVSGDLSSTDRTGGPDPEIVSVLADPALAVRAIHLLVLSGVPAAEVLKGMQLHASGQPVAEVANTTLEALSARRPLEEVSMALLDMLRNIETSSESSRPGLEKSGVASSMTWLRQGTVVIPGDAFRQFFEQFDRLQPEVRELAAATLSRLDPDLDVRLREVLSSVDVAARLKAVRIVTALSREHEVEETLLELVEDPDERVRATVVKTLAILDSEPAVRALLTAVTDFDRRVVANTVEAIEASGFPQLVGLMQILAGHVNNRIRANAVKALLQMHSPGAEEALVDMLASPVEMMRLSAVWVLGEVDFPGALDWLRRLAREDPSPRVRQKVAGILEDIA